MRPAGIDCRVSDAPVVSESNTGDTSFLREGQTVTVEGRRTNRVLDATRVDIVAETP